MNEFVFGVIVGAGLLATGEAAWLLWCARPRVVSMFRNYRVVCRECKTAGSDTGVRG